MTTSAKWLRLGFISVVLSGNPAVFGDTFFDDFNDGDLFDDGWEVCDGDANAWRPCDGRACVDYGNPTAGVDNMLCRGDSNTPVASVEATMHFPSSDIQLGLTLNRGEVQEKGVYIDQRLGQTRVQLAQVGSPSKTFTCFFDPWTFPHTAVVRWEAVDGMMRAYIDGHVCETELISPAIGRVKLMRDADPSNVPGAWFDDVSLVTRHGLGFTENWEKGTIDPDRWVQLGTPAPLVSSPGFDGSGFALDPNGDAWCDSGVVSVASVPLDNLSIKWVAKETTFGTHHQDVEVGVTKAPLPSSATCFNQGYEKHASLRIVGTSQRMEFWVRDTLSGVMTLPDTDWHSYKLRINPSGTVSFFFDNDDTPVHTSTETIDLPTYTEGRILLGGRSISTPSLIDNVVVHAPLNRTIEFSNIIWNVRDWPGGPGTSCWSSSEDSVWVDQNGALHLKIRKIAGYWCGAEVNVSHTANYGLHKFSVASDPIGLDANAVLGMFLYKQDSTCTLCPQDPTQRNQCVCEIDIEITGGFQGETRCGEVPSEQHGFFILRPPSTATCRFFEWPSDASISTHEIQWWPESILFTSWLGSCSPFCDNIIQTWELVSGFIPPVEAGLRTIINFWPCFDEGIACDGTLSEEQKVVIDSYTESIIDIFPFIFFDGFESGDLSSWSASAP